MLQDAIAGAGPGLGAGTSWHALGKNKSVKWICVASREMEETHYLLPLIPL